MVSQKVYDPDFVILSEAKNPLASTARSLAEFTLSRKPRSFAEFILS
jgi:hypothetical protein